MTQAPGKWDDLTTRVFTGIVLASVGAVSVWAGGIWFAALVILAIGAMIWELTFIARADDGALSILLAVAAALSVVIHIYFPASNPYLVVLPFLAVFGFSTRRMRLSGTVYAGAIMLTALGLIELRSTGGAVWVLWLVLVVVASDIAGYLAGRLIGGPKFWPSVSPKKTWSGTIAGWVGAALVGAIMAPYLGTGPNLIWVSVLLGFSGQLGDIAESALKRKSRIKDSSNLLPGHGGVLDRLDALIGATLALLIVSRLSGLSG